MVRDDLADVEFADRVFAPHYARGVPRLIVCDADVLAKPMIGAETVGHVAVGNAVDLFDVSGGWAWVRSFAGPGYVPVDALSAA